MGITQLLFYLCLCPAMFRKEVDMQIWYSVSHLRVTETPALEETGGAELWKQLSQEVAPKQQVVGNYISTLLEFLV